MICYKDRDFCSFYEDCHDDECDRRLTPDIIQAAERHGLYISQYMDKPGCFIKKVSK